MKKLLCIGLPTWEGDYLKSTVQLMKALAQDYDILYVEYTFTWLDVWRGVRREDAIPVKRILGLQPRLRKIELENGNALHVLTLPPFLPANWLSAKWYDRITKWNALLSLQILKPILRKLHFDNPLVVNAFQPGLGLALQGKLNEKQLAYYCYDEIGAAPWIGKHGARLEQAFLPKVDIVITSSSHLQKEKSTFNSNCKIVKNGVDIAQFQQVTNTVIIENIEKYTHIIGYIGSVDERLDYDLLSQVISSMSDQLFVFVGRVRSEIGRQRLQAFDNVRLIGAKPPVELPSFVQQFDIGLIPFIKNELTAGIYPMKINEYLALGKPVVATDFADLSDFEPLIAVAATAQDFVQAIQQTLRSNSLIYKQLRKEMARSNSWENRALEFKKALEVNVKPIPHFMND